MDERDKDSMDPDQHERGGQRESPGERMGGKSDEELRGIADEEDFDDSDDMDEEEDESTDDGD